MNNNALTAMLDVTTSLQSGSIYRSNDLIAKDVLKGLSHGERAALGRLYSASVQELPELVEVLGTDTRNHNVYRRK